MTSCCCYSTAGRAGATAGRAGATAGRAGATAGRASAKELATIEVATGQETPQLQRDVKSFLKELSQKVMQPIP